MGRNGEVVIIRLSITPSANRNTYSVATLIIHIPRVEALHASTLGYEIATPTELPGVRTIPLWTNYIFPLSAYHTPHTTHILPGVRTIPLWTNYIFPLSAYHTPHTTHILPGVRTIHLQAPSQHRGPIPTFPKGKEHHTIASNTVIMDSRPWGWGTIARGFNSRTGQKGSGE